MKKFLHTSLFLFGSLAFAQSGANVFPFLNIPVSARQAALGGDAVSIRDHDVSFAMVNPALLNVENHNQLSVNGAMYLAGSAFGTIGYGRDFENGHLMTVHAKYMDYGKMTRTDNAGFENGQFGASDIAIGGGYAYQFEDEWTIGANVNLVSSKIDSYTSMAVAGSVAASYHFEKTRETVSLVARNFGYQFKTFNGTREQLPFRIDLGYTRILKKFPAAITITAHDLQQFNISSTYDINGREVTFARKILDHLSFGAEFFPDKPFNIRLGYNIKRGNELAVLDQRSLAGLSAGFGIRFNGIRIDYSHVRYHNSSNMNIIGMSFDLSGKRN